MAEGIHYLVGAEGEPEISAYGVDAEGLVIYRRKEVVESLIHIVVQIFLQDAEVGIFRLEVHVEELAHIAEGHVVDDVSEVVGHFGYRVVEDGGDVDPADLGGDLEPVVRLQLVDGETVHILQVVDDGLHKFQDGLVIDRTLVFQDVGAQGALDLPDAHQSACGDDRAHDGDDEQYHAYDKPDDKVECSHL